MLATGPHSGNPDAGRKALLFRAVLGGLFCLSLMFAAPVGMATAQDNNPQSAASASPGLQSFPAPSIKQPVTIGALQLSAQPAADGKSVQVSVLLQTVLVASAVLHPASPKYAFDVTVGTATANGSFTAVFLPYNQFSSVTASSTLKVEGQADQPFSGAVRYWTIPAGQE